MNNLTPTRRKGRKYSQVVEGARKVFLQDGYDGASVDDIAREAGVSKATLYSYFPDKRLLFVEIARQECLRQAEDSRSIVPPDLPVREVLEQAALRIVSASCSSLSLSIFRVCASEAERFPELAQEFYQNGPQLAQTLLAGYMRDATERGELKVTDPELAAEQFIQLCRADVFTRRLFGIDPRISPERAKIVSHEAVETFMARYGTDAGN